MGRCWVCCAAPTAAAAAQPAAAASVAASTPASASTLSLSTTTARTATGASVSPHAVRCGLQLHSGKRPCRKSLLSGMLCVHDACVFTLTKRVLVSFDGAIKEIRFGRGVGTLHLVSLHSLSPTQPSLSSLVLSHSPHHPHPTADHTAHGLRVCGAHHRVSHRPRRRSG